MISRSDLLRAGGALIVSFGVPSAADALAPVLPAGTQPLYPRVDPAKLDSWIAIDHDGRVTVFTGRIDFGQHKKTAFAQIVAEELDVPFAAVNVVMGDTARTPNQGSSSASDGMFYGARPLRHAAAEARRVLVNLAAQRLDVPPADIVVNDGILSSPQGSERLSFAQLIGSDRFNVALTVTNPDSLITDVTGIAKPKDPRAYTIVGTSIPGVDIPAKVDGTFARVQNVRLPGMLHARLVLPPAPGAHVVRVGALDAASHGKVQLIVKGDLIGLVAANEWNAIRAAEKLHVDWTAPQALPGGDGFASYLRTAPPMFPQKQPSPPVGDVDAALAGAAQTFAADFNYPAQSHGMIGPACGVADVRTDHAVVYAGTQDPGATRAAVADMLRMPLESVRLIPVEPSGAYGRLGLDDATVAAAVLSHAAGKPVRVQFTRDQEHTWAPLQPPSSFTMRAGVDATGKIIGWDQQEWSWAWVDAELPLMLVPKDDIIGKRVPLFRGVAGGESNAYSFDTMRLRSNTAPPLLRGWAMRSPGRVQVNFAGEQFIDEIAAATGQDPIVLRLRHVTDERTLAVLHRVADLSRWQTRPSPHPDARSSARIAHGRGVALVANQRGTFIATVAEVEVDRVTGHVAVKRIFSAVDPGLVVNPNGLLAQIEGATIYGTSRALKEQITHDRSRVTSDDWKSYPILRFTEVPEIAVAVINRPELPPGGIGEPPNTTPAAAIGNAIFDAAGIRLREIPYSPARVKAALAALVPA